MLDQPKRPAILLLKDQGHAIRAIAWVHKKLVDAGAEHSYQALTEFCRRNGIGCAPRQPSGEYHFALVERNFDFIENNFLAGREFKDWDDLNQQARAWCEKVNATHKRSLHAAPRDLFRQEQSLLRPLPIWVPTVCAIETRIIDSYGNVNIGGNRYSVPYTLIGRQFEVHETKDGIEVFEGHRVVASHSRVLEALGQRVLEPSHRAPRGEWRPKAAPPREEDELLRAEPRLGDYLAAIKARCPGRRVRMLRRLLGMLRDYPRPMLLAAVDAALAYGLFDLDRLDRMVLRNIARDYFVLEAHGPRRSGFRPQQGEWP